jgi:flagellar hook-associated protein 3 FlgL
MRVTNFMIYSQLTRSLHDGLRRLSEHSERISSGKKINRPSDNVSGMTRVMDYRKKLGENEQYKKNVEEAEAHLSFADTTMSSVVNSLTRARELAVQGANGSLTDVDRDAIAAEVENLRDEVMSLANSQFRDRYIFSGFRTDTQAFDAGFNYQGDSNEINVMIDRNATVSLTIPGNTAFIAGGETYFETLDNLRIALENNNEAGIQSAISSIENALDQALNVRTDIGARLNYLENHKKNLEDRDYALTTFMSNIEDTDMAESVSELAKTEVALEALRQAGAKSLSQSLMDFLR